MNKELEFRAKKYAEENVEDTLFDAFLEGATDSYIEKQKLEFAIEQLKSCTHAPTIRLGIVLEELEQKLSEI